jgi:CubicO group peptidase (beta-lactamase class C family)
MMTVDQWSTPAMRDPTPPPRSLTLCRGLAAVVVLVTAVSRAAEPTDVWPSPDWPAADPADAGLDAARLADAKDYALSAGGSGMIVRYGKVVLHWGDQRQKYDIKSATKSFGATMLGVAVKDGKIDLDAPARRYHPSLGVPPESNLQTGWLDEITIRHLATQTAGFEKPGGYEPLLFRPGTQWHYSDGGPNWLAECITLQYGRDLEELMFERVFTPLGITRDDLHWRKNQYRPREIDGIPRREFGAGIHANVEALSRIGYLYLHKGRWKDTQILAPEFVEIATRPAKEVVGLPEWKGDAHGNASDHYGLLWWNNADGALEGAPRDAFWAWGLYDSLMIVVPSLDLVIVRGGAGGRSLPREKDGDHYDVLKPFLGPIVKGVSVVRGPSSVGTDAAGRTEDHGLRTTDPLPPYPPSTLITGIEWAPPNAIVRAARGSDNWPLTWADDGDLYGAYGDGNGFEPFVERKLSLGLARITGGPDSYVGSNVRSPDMELLGDGAQGRKASGLLMVDGVLYLWARNAGNAQLAWSSDYSKTWTWADWKWTTSFGCPTFLNFGQNYAGARDDHVYIYSPDSDSAYDPADRMVLARVPVGRIRDQVSYEFFTAVDASGRPGWSGDIGARGAVFSHPGRCYRSGITYNAGLRRYLWCQVLPESTDPRGPRFQGGFGTYDAPEPWGPWTTVFFTNAWDVGPGETSSLPTKWMSDDGRTVHLAFSGNDQFSVRRATLTIAGDGGQP